MYYKAARDAAQEDVVGAADIADDLSRNYVIKKAKKPDGNTDSPDEPVPPAVEMAAETVNKGGE